MNQFEIQPPSSHGKEPDLRLEQGVWPGKRALFICKANMGRSQIAEAVFKKYYPGVRVGSAGILGNSGALHPHSLVRTVMEEHRYDLSSHRVKQLRPEMVTSDTDVFILCEPEFIRFLHPYVLKRARSVIAIDIPDPSVPNQSQTSRYSFSAATHDTHKILDELIGTRLRDIMLGVRNHEYDDRTLDGIVYPFGIPIQPPPQKQIFPYAAVINPTGNNELFGYPF